MSRDGNITYDHNQKTGMAVVQYKIRNDAGIELPHTGGPGTDHFCLIGLMLAALSGAGLLMKRRRYKA